MFQRGDEVLAPWMDEPFVYPAIVVEVGPDTLRLAYLDGDSGEVAPSLCRRGLLGRGVAVSVNWKGKGKYYRGAIRERVGVALLVDFEDGERSWTTVAQCRVLRAVAEALPSERVHCTFCGCAVDERESRCSECGAPTHR